MATTEGAAAPNVPDPTRPGSRSEWDARVRANWRDTANLIALGARNPHLAATQQRQADRRNR